MPCITVDGFQIRIIPGDHSPAHVHVVGGSGEAIFLISPNIVLRDAGSMSKSDRRKAAMAILSAHGAPKIIEETPVITAAARARGNALKQSPFAIMSAKYDAAHDCLKFTLRDETVLVLPRASLEVRRIARARSQDLRRVEIDELRTHVWFPDIEEGLNPVGLMARRLNSVLQAERGKNGGRVRSAAKAKASKANGKKGGRPRKASVSNEY